MQQNASSQAQMPQTFGRDLAKQYSQQNASGHMNQQQQSKPETNLEVLELKLDAMKSDIEAMKSHIKHLEQQVEMNKKRSW
jgi:polyhydroxyalkanoate synthesis regulator phasin